MTVKKTHQLINVIFTKDKNYKPVIIIIERVNGVKNIRRVDNPTIDIYFSNEFAREEYKTKRKPRFMDKDLLDVYEVGVDEINEAIIELIIEYDNDEERKEKYVNQYNMASKKGFSGFRDMQVLHKHPYLFSSDVNVADHYISKWHIENSHRTDYSKKLEKAFWDIEVDIIDYEDGFPDEHIAPCPVSMISYVFGDTAHLYCLKLENNESFDHFYNNQLEDFSKEMLDMYGPAAKARGDFPIALFEDLEIHFYDDELDLIHNFFNLVNKDEPDTLSAWNAKFDVLTVMNRIKLHGYDPEAFIVPEELQDIAKVNYFEDTFNSNWKDKKDTITVTGSVTYDDQLLTYASLRATMGQKESYALNDVLEEETGFSKLDLGKYTLKNLPYKNYYYYAHYSLRDTLGLKLLENKTKDLDQIYGLAVQTRTRLEKAFTKTICLRNYSFELRKDTQILTSNPNLGSFPDDPPTPKMKFEGAVVADPTLILPMQSEAMGMPSRYIRDNAVDFDYKALYPRIMQTFGIDDNTFLGTIDIDMLSEDFDPEEPQSLTKRLVEDMISDNLISTASFYFNFPSMTSLKLNKVLING